MNKKRLENSFWERGFFDDIRKEQNIIPFTNFISFNQVRKKDVFAELFFAFFSFPKGLS